MAEQGFEEEVMELLAELVAIPSVVGEEEQLARRLLSLLREAGLTAELIEVEPGRPDLVVDAGRPDGAALLLMGHLDTVPPVQGWQADPFSPRLAGNRLVGLGAWDMKAGLSAMVAAARRHPADGPRLKLAFVVDEEGESRGVETLVRSGWLAGVAAAVVPEAGLPVGDRGAEPALVLGRRGRVLVEVELHGRAAHGSDSDQGHSALLDAARVALELGCCPTAGHPLLGNGVAVARSIHSASGTLSVPCRASLGVDRLLVPPESPESAVEELRSHLASLGLRSRVQVRAAPRCGPYLAPYVISRDHPLVQQALSVMGGDVQVVYDPSVADENRLSMEGIPVVGLAPRGGNCHQGEEWVDLESVARLASRLTSLAALGVPL